MLEFAWLAEDWNSNEVDEEDGVELFADEQDDIACNGDVKQSLFAPVLLFGLDDENVTWAAVAAIDFDLALFVFSFTE